MDSYDENYAYVYEVSLELERTILRLEMLHKGLSVFKGIKYSEIESAIADCYSARSKIENVCKFYKDLRDLAHKPIEAKNERK